MFRQRVSVGSEIARLAFFQEASIFRAYKGFIQFRRRCSERSELGESLVSLLGANSGVVRRFHRVVMIDWLPKKTPRTSGCQRFWGECFLANF